MKKRFMVAFVLFFASGIIGANLLSVSMACKYLLFAVSLASGFLLRKKSGWLEVCILCVAFFFGACLLESAQRVPDCHIRNFYLHTRSPVHVIKGFIIQEPQDSYGGVSFVLRAQELHSETSSRSCCGDILVYVGGKGKYSYGESLLIKGKLQSFSRRGLTHKDKYGAYLYNRGIFLALRALKGSGVVRVHKNQGLLLKRFALYLKEGSARIFSRHTSPITASILKAMVLGEKQGVPKSIYRAMIHTGTVHILVVSGFNVGIVSMLLLCGLKLIRVPRKARFVLCIPFLILYCFITGACAPVVRASILAILLLCAKLAQREADTYVSFALAAFIILLYDPRQLFDVGFQLSFSSVFAILYLYPKFSSFLRSSALKKRYSRYILEAGLVSLAAWTGTVFFIAYHFKVITPVTVFANIAIVPLATLITLCGFTLLTFNFLCPSLILYAALTTELCCYLLVKINLFFAKLPWAQFRI